MKHLNWHNQDQSPSESAPHPDPGTLRTREVRAEECVGPTQAGRSFRVPHRKRCAAENMGGNTSVPTTDLTPVAHHRAGRIPSLLAALLAIVGCAASAQKAVQPKAPQPARICMTEWAGYYDSTEAQFNVRFKHYRELGVDTIRVQTGWLDKPAFVSALRKSNFRIKLILYVLGIDPQYAKEHPADRMVDEHGVADWHLGPWNPDLEATTLNTASAELKRARDMGIAGNIDELVVDLGPAGEGIYPANWTVNDRQGEEAYWCYSAAAQASFRRAMQAKYSRIEVACDTWSLSGNQRFASWEALSIPPPRTAWARGPFWNDMLTWYRDSKRVMLSGRIAQTQYLAKRYLQPDARCVVYLPGYAYSQQDWSTAVNEASGPASIRLMMDNDWLMQTAIDKGCELQYTGVENVDEVRNITRKLRDQGSKAASEMWGENAGNETAGRNPEWLARVITSYGLRGVDFTWSNWLFEKDGTTPSPTFNRFAHAVKMIDTFYRTGKTIPAASAESFVHREPNNAWQLDCTASTRLMSSFPEVIKGSDPEIAAVGDGQMQRMLLKFPIEALPPSARIASATLVMHRYLTYSDDIADETLGVYRVARDWDEIAASWNEARAGATWVHAGGDATGSNDVQYKPDGASTPWAVATAKPFTKVGEAIEWDVTDLVKALVTGPNNGIMVALTHGGHGNKSFASASHADPNMGPVLVIKTQIR